MRIKENIPKAPLNYNKQWIENPDIEAFLKWCKENNCLYDYSFYPDIDWNVKYISSGRETDCVFVKDDTIYKILKGPKWIYSKIGMNNFIPPSIKTYLIGACYSFNRSGNEYIILPIVVQKYLDEKKYRFGKSVISDNYGNVKNQDDAQMLHNFLVKKGLDRKHGNYFKYDDKGNVTHKIGDLIPKNYLVDKKHKRPYIIDASLDSTDKASELNYGDKRTVDKKVLKSILKETEIFYGVDLDEVLDFIKYCNKSKAAKGCWLSMADRWKDRHSDSSDLVAAAKRISLYETILRKKDALDTNVLN